jgi:hypothetical protein
MVLLFMDISPFILVVVLDDSVREFLLNVQVGRMTCMHPTYGQVNAPAK